MATGYLVTLGSDQTLWSGDAISTTTTEFTATAGEGYIGSGSWTVTGIIDGQQVTNATLGGTYYLGFVSGSTTQQVYFVPDATDVQITSATVYASPVMTVGGLLYGDANANSFTGTTGPNIAWGLGGNDTLIGGPSNAGEADTDVLHGGDGNDWLSGGDGMDRLEGGAGNDYMNGGYGTDIADLNDGTAGVNISVGNGTKDLTAAGLGVDTYDGIDGFIGTNFSDTLTGFNGDGVDPDGSIYTNYIDGAGGNDSIDGLSGSDELFGGSGNDTIVGGLSDGDAGHEYQSGRLMSETGTIDDRIYGGTGNDVIYGDDVAGTSTLGGNDLIDGGSGSDSIISGAGNDTVYAGADNDTVLGGAGADSIFGQSGTDNLSGGDGNDTIDGGIGSDTIAGGAGIDSLLGGDGADTIDGGLDNDSIAGGAGNDSLLGGDGNDTVDGGADADTILGGAGTDSLLGGTGNDNIDGGDGADTIDGGLDNDSITGGAGNDSLLGSDGNDTVDGGDGNDTVDGGLGADLIFGGIGNDSLLGGTGNDTIDGGADADSISGGAGNDNLMGGDGNDTVDGGADADVVSGGAGNDTLLGGDGNDTVDGGADADVVSGGTGNDSLMGGDGNDTIAGGAYDAATGIHTDDNQADTLTGGLGDDTFLAENTDLITDFNTGNTGAIDDGNQANNDFVDLGTDYYNDANLAIWNANNPDQQYATPLGWMRADQADDGILNNISTANGFAEDFTFTIQSGGTATAVDQLTFDNTNVVCFDAGVMIETDHGPVAAGDLKVGDLVVTRDAGLQPIRWVGRRDFGAAALAASPSLRPIRIARGALGQGLPVADLVVSPQHRILVRSQIAQKMFGTNEVLVAARQLCQLDGIDIATDMNEVGYVHFMFDAHQIVLSNGAETESMYTGAEALKSVGAAAREEIFAIFPDLRNGEAGAPARILATGRMGRKLAVRHAQNSKPLVL